MTTLEDLIQRRCAVTGFDRKVFVSRDGRERGLWFGVKDQGLDLGEVRRKRLRHCLYQWFDEIGFDNDPSKRATAEMLFCGFVGDQCKTNIHEMGLLEWDAVQKVYEAIGAELKKHRKRKSR